MLTEIEIKIIAELRKSKRLATTPVAKALYMHRNTVVYHIERICEKTGYDPQTFDGMRALLEMVEGSDEKNSCKS